MRFILITGPTMFLIYFLSSCSPVSNIVQVFDVTSTDCILEKGYLRYENDSLRIIYMFWGENGTMGIFIHNKSEIPLYIDWKKCSFIVGDFKNDYWNDVIISITDNTTSSIGVAQQRGASSASYWINNFIPQIITGNVKQSSTSNSYWLEQTFSSSATIISKPERITFIPPHVTICQSAFTLIDNGFNIDPIAYYLDTTVLVEDKQLQKFQKKTVKLKNVDFNISNTPLQFRSYLTYSYDEQFDTEEHIDNSFFISRIMQMSKRTFTARPVVPTPEYLKANMWSSPTSFYIHFEVP